MQARAFGRALAGMSLAAVLLFVIRMSITDSTRYYFLIWNMVLAWIPLACAYWLYVRLIGKNTPWITVPNGLLGIGWLLFLPNSFYLISDLVHLRSTGQINILFDAVMFVAFIMSCMCVGYTSIVIMHTLVHRKVSSGRAYVVIALVLLLCSYAIYLGRVLRWNSWDVFLHPAGILFDVSEQLVNPVTHPQALLATTSFFILIVAGYLVIWNAVMLARKAGAARDMQ